MTSLAVLDRTVRFHHMRPECFGEGRAVWVDLPFTDGADLLTVDLNQMRGEWRKHSVVRHLQTLQGFLVARLFHKAHVPVHTVSQRILLSVSPVPHPGRHYDRSSSASTNVDGAGKEHRLEKMPERGLNDRYLWIPLSVVADRHRPHDVAKMRCAWHIVIISFGFFEMHETSTSKNGICLGHSFGVR